MSDDLMYNTLDTIYDAGLPENEQELEIFQGLYKAYSQATSQHRIADRVDAFNRREMPTVSDAVSTTTFNLGEIVLKDGAQPRPKDQPKK